MYSFCLIFFFVATGEASLIFIFWKRNTKTGKWKSRSCSSIRWMRMIQPRFSNESSSLSKMCSCANEMHMYLPPTLRTRSNSANSLLQSSSTYGLREDKTFRLIHHTLREIIRVCLPFHLCRSSKRPVFLCQWRCRIVRLQLPSKHWIKFSFLET